MTEQELFALGIEAKHARPYHPQTCGKVERFHQTMKKFLAKQEHREPQSSSSASSIASSSTTTRSARTGASGARHQRRSTTHGRRPCPLRHSSRWAERRLRFDRVDRAGRITLRHRGRLHHIGIGNAYAGWRVAMLIDGLDIEIVGFDGSPLRRLVLDPTKDYQRIP